MRPSLHEYFMSIAKCVAQRSTCLDKQVGCVLVDRGQRIVACGYNGVQSKEVHCSELGFCAKDQGRPCRALHAEANALAYCSGHPVTCYCTLEPCKDCAKLLRNAGIRTVIYSKPTSAKKSGKEDFGGDWVALADSRMTSLQLSSMDDVLANVREYHVALNYPEPTTDPEVKARQIRELILAAQVELVEVLNEADWKPWKAYGGNREIRKGKFVEELGDVIFFLDSLLMVTNTSWGELAKWMNRKVVENYGRLDSGYHN